MAFDPFKVSEIGKNTDPVKPDPVKPDPDKPVNPVKPDPVKPDDAVDFKAKYDRFSNFDTDEFNELVPLIEGVDGADYKVKIKTFVEDHKKTKAEIDKLREQDAERERWFKQNQIQNSQEFNEKYAKPVTAAVDLYNATIGEHDAEGNPKNEQVWVKLREAVFNQGKDMNAAQIKALLQTFSKQYKDRFQEEPDLPTIKQVMEARESIVTAQSRKLQAIQEWDALQEQNKIARINQETLQQQETRKAKVVENAQKVKDFAASKFDRTPYEGIVDDAMFSDVTKEVDVMVREMTDGTSNPDLESFLYLTYKAKMFDKLLVSIKEDRSIAADYKKGLGDPGSGGTKHGDFVNKDGNSVKISSFLDS